MDPEIEKPSKERATPSVSPEVQEPGFLYPVNFKFSERQADTAQSYKGLLNPERFAEYFKLDPKRTYSELLKLFTDHLISKLYLSGGKTIVVIVGNLLFERYPEKGFEVLCDAALGKHVFSYRREAFKVDCLKVLYEAIPSLSKEQRSTLKSVIDNLTDRINSEELALDEHLLIAIDQIYVGLQVDPELKDDILKDAHVTQAVKADINFTAILNLTSNSEILEKLSLAALATDEFVGLSSKIRIEAVKILGAMYENKLVDDDEKIVSPLVQVMKDSAIGDSPEQIKLFNEALEICIKMPTGKKAIRAAIADPDLDSEVKKEFKEGLEFLTS